MAITNKQKALVHVAQSRLGLSDEEYREALRYIAGVESSRDLDHLGLDMLMEHFHQLGFESDFRAQNFGVRPCMASFKQVAFLRHLWCEYTEAKGTDLTLGKWLDRTFKVSALRFLDGQTARKAITALIKMNERKPAA